MLKTSDAHETPQNPSPITDNPDDALECATLLAQCLALMRGRSCTEVVRAVLASRTLAAAGYTDMQDGRLTHEQALVALGLLHAWVGREIDRQRKDGQSG